MFFPSRSLSLLFLAVAVAGRRAPVYKRSESAVISLLSATDPFTTTAFGAWIQLAADTVLPILKNPNSKELTIVVPSNAAFNDFVTSRGGNISDPASISTAEWVQVWEDVFPYFFFQGIYTTDLLSNTTTVLDSVKTSALGDWPLSIGLRFDEDQEAADNSTSTASNTRRDNDDDGGDGDGDGDTTDGDDGDTTDVYNGTVYSTPYGSGNIIIPDTPLTDTIYIQVVDYWPTLPRNLSATIAALNVTAWSAISSRLPSIAGLETQYNYTLLLPPQDALSEALSLSDSALLAFMDAHVISGARVVLPAAGQNYTSAAGGSVKISQTAGVDGSQTGVADGSQTAVVGGSQTGIVVAGSVEAKVTARDVLTDGGIVQVSSSSTHSSRPHRDTQGFLKAIDRALVEVSTSSSKRLEEEL
ncbi:hypothetical protein PLICRDRAFT_178446 [Plicaturopsis crispa FD-325 SS-3]|nr:hypothetical protein PLICRDRAFT_178446 [Plicaturopsis crispa FD-325 SS-3]